MPNRSLTISRIAKAAGIGIETIRYYQRLGLIAEPVKPPAGYRIYPQETINRLYFIQRAKQLGFTLAEIADLLELGVGECAKTQGIAQRKLDLIRSKIDGLSSMAGVLEELLRTCQANSSHRGCPIIKTLSED